MISFDKNILARFIRCWLFAAVFLMSLQWCAANDGVDFFERKVRPLLVEKCGDCHGADDPDGKLTLISVAGILKGGKSGGLLVPGKPEQSRLIQAVRYTSKPKMPPDEKLPPDEVAILEKWVRDGAALPGNIRLARANKSGDFQISDEDRRWWSFQPIGRFDPPAIENKGRVRTPIDRFVLRKLEEHELTLSADADRRTLIRRVTFDLTGLPPTPDEVHAFVNDSHPAAYERLVDRLLASPSYGIRWGRHWLDLARYADTNGGGFDYVYPNAWRYRDYVVNAFNAGMPYDQFLIEQLAGDLLPVVDDAEQHAARLTATGLLTLAPKGLGMQDKEQMILDVVDDQIDLLGRSLIGLTLSCARCHDHKFDPISTEDYYALAGIFRSTSSLSNTDKNPSYWPESPLELPSVTVARKKYQARKTANQKAIAEEKKKANAVLIAAAKNRESDYIEAAKKIRAAVSQQTAIGHWAFDEKYGDKVVASTGLDGALSNANNAKGPKPKRVEGRLGGALRFDGQREIVEVSAEGMNFGKSTDFTLSLWLRAAKGYSPKTADTILQVNYPAALWFVALRPGSYNGFYLRHYDGKRAVDIKPNSNRLPTLTDNHWHHVLFTSDRSGQGTIYLDGKVAGTVPIATISSAAEFDNAKKFTIGASNNQFRGELDDVAIWSRVLSQVEIQRIFNQQQNVTQIEAPFRDKAAGFTYQDAVKQGLVPSILRGFVDLTAKASGDPLAKLIAGKKTSPYVVDSKTEQFYSDEVKQRLRELAATAQQIEQTRVPDPVLAMIARDQNKVADLRVHIAGDRKNLGNVVSRGFPQIVGDVANLPVKLSRGNAQKSGRLELARWLTSPDHPLTARVFVNHRWKWHFGHGLVQTPDNFGRLGEKPSHPELLDWLARRLVENGWSVKDLHRQLLLSSTYRQCSVVADSRASHVDSGNRLLWRMNRRRLEGEALRDAMLSVSGQLDLQMAGTVNTWRAKMFSVDDGNRETANYDTRRRSVYLPVVRGAALHEMLQLFDFGDPNSISAHRDTTTVAPQALFMLNSPFVIEQAQHLATRLLRHDDIDVESRICLAYQITLSRLPTDVEKDRAAQFINPTEPNDWRLFCQMLLCLNEFAYVE
ncbi:MAG: hypothetical protein CMJ78_26575 [Planctomycetaceae bacterium]|nr:hypothetical protein [Planctomycetaceae bacterium]